MCVLIDHFCVLMDQFCVLLIAAWPGGSGRVLCYRRFVASAAGFLLFALQAGPRLVLQAGWWISGVPGGAVGSP